MNQTTRTQKRNEESKKGLENCIRRAHEMILTYGNRSDQTAIEIVKQAIENKDNAERLLKIITDRELEQQLKAIDTYHPRKI